MKTTEEKAREAFQAVFNHFGWYEILEDIGVIIQNDWTEEDRQAFIDAYAGLIAEVFKKYE